MIEYFLTTAIVWLAAYIIYLLLLKGETLFAFNRLFLLSSIVVGIFAPFLSNFLSPAIEFIAPFNLNAVEISSLGQTISRDANSFSIWTFVILLYLSGCIIYTFRIAFSWLKLYRLSANINPISMNKQLVYPTKDVDSPFFWNGKIFIPAEILDYKDKLRLILRHELSHKKYKHHYDQYIMIISKLIFWWNPLLYLIENELRLLHEYQADARVCTKYNRKKYGRMLIQFSSQSLTNRSVHGIFSHQLKNRLIMLGKKSHITTAVWKYSTASLLLLIVFGLSIAISPNEIQAQEDGKAFVRADEMPLFPTCEDRPESERNQCSQQKLLKFISENISYPDEAKKKEIEGTVYTSFIVNEKGLIDDVETIRSPDSQLSEVARNIILSMNEMNERWTPGKKDGKAVSVKYTLPIKFQLPKEKESGDKG